MNNNRKNLELDTPGYEKVSEAEESRKKVDADDNKEKKKLQLDTPDVEILTTDSEKPESNK